MTIVDRLLAEPSWIHLCAAESDATDGDNGGGGGEGGDEGAEDDGVLDAPAEGQEGAELQADPDDEEEEIEVADRKVALPKWLAKEFKEGTQRNADYTNKTKALAETTRQREAEFKTREEMITLRGAVHEEAREIKGLDTELTKLRTDLSEWAGITEAQWANLKATDPDKYAAARESIDRLKDRRDTLRDRRTELFDGLQGKVNELRGKETAERTALIERVNTEASAHIKGWGEEKKQALAKFATEAYGLPPQVFALALTSAPALRILHDLMQLKTAMRAPVITAKGVAAAAGAAAAKKPDVKPVARITGAGGKSTTAAPSDNDDPDAWVKKRYAQINNRKSNGQFRVGAR